MAGLVRIGFRRILCNANNISQIKEPVLVRTITSRTTRSGENRPPKPKPWPYTEKKYNNFHALFDKTSARFDDNSKIVVVEGPVAAGKSKLAKDLAANLDMLYMPEANLDMFYINSYGYDLRKLDSQLPESLKSFDVMNFLQNPKHRNVARYQIEQYMVRFSQYIDALAHVFSTGQGVVLDRCPYSDFVFAETMYKYGYLSRAAYKKYYEFRDNTIIEVMKPHLVIYLDVPVPKVIENIKKRAISWEKNSTVLTPDYLKTMEEYYKQYLKEISKDAELLIYDWSEEGDVEIVVEDVERLTFEYDSQDTRMRDWKFELEEDWAWARNYYSVKKNDIMYYFNAIPCFEVPELCTEPLDSKIYYDLMKQTPGEKFMPGFNTDMGDDGYLFKMSGPFRHTLPLRERRKSL